MNKKNFFFGCAALLGLHIVCMVLGSWERSADGWIHLFFSEHWYLRWFDHWEPRWSMGFSMFSYPPLAHQCVALLRFVLNPIAAGITLMTLTLITLASGLYRYGRLWFSKNICQIATLLLLSSSPLAIAVHTFGQLPNLLALGFLLHGLACSRHWLTQNKSLTLTLSLCLCAIFTSLYASVFGLLLLGIPVLWLYRREHNFVKRVGVLSLWGVGLSIVALSPFLYFRWYLAAVEAAPVYHSSQGNVLAFKAFNWYMFYGQYASLLVLWPCFFWVRSSVLNTFWRTQSIAIVIMLVLSTGSATGFVPWILGPVFTHLNLDRFGQWASFILLLPLGYIMRVQWLKPSSRPWHQIWISAGLGVHLLAFAYSASTPWRKPLPQMLPLHNVQRFLDEHSDYRYLTLGLRRANQAKLSTLSHAQNIDGNFPFGRHFAPLDASGIATLDMARHYRKTGIKTLSTILQNAPRYHLKYVIVKDSRYARLLYDHGFKPIQKEKPLTIWENAEIRAINAESTLQHSAPESPLTLFLLTFLWSIGPLLSLITALFFSRSAFIVYRGETP